MMFHELTYNKQTNPELSYSICSSEIKNNIYDRKLMHIHIIINVF